MNRMCTRNLILLPALVATGWITGCAGRNVSILVTRPAEINLSQYDKITIGELRGSGSGIVSRLSDLGKFLQGVESRDTWVRRLSAEMSQALSASGRFELLDYENLQAGRGRDDENGNIVLITGGILAYDYDEEEINEDGHEEEQKDRKGIRPVENTNAKVPRGWKSSFDSWTFAHPGYWPAGISSGVSQ